ncbi:acetylcholinesterase-like [Ornithodoros turicata]|uniref:acetylcholinesterase-like n=1 Tax=Ornithodoros turicata TaxID=34597 RepID=UPI00313993C7
MMAEKVQAGRAGSYLGTIDSERLDRFLKLLPAITIVLTLVAFVAFVFTYRERQTNHVYTVQGYDSQLQGQSVTVEGIAVLAFLGVPFAQSTGGERRFRRPEPVSPPSTLQANHKRPPCVQRMPTGARGVPPAQGPQSEDCLHLNIWVPPAKDSKERKAVLVFLYGFDFQYGANTNENYDGRYLAALGDVIVVVPNYRLGIFGFLMAGTSEEPGNLGLLDQKLALDWVRFNIGYFGGDEDNITLWGVDAGAVSIAMHMLSPLATTIHSAVKRYILHSSSIFKPYADNTRRATQNIVSVARQLNCGEGPMKQVLECLRSLPADQLLQTDAVLNGTFVPSFNSEYLPDKPFNLVAKVPIARKQILLGNVADEGTYSVLSALDKRRDLAASLPSELRTTHPAMWLLDIPFNPTNDNDSKRAAAHLRGDYNYVCPCQYFAHYLSRGRDSQVYTYLMNHKPSYSSWPETKEMTRYEDVDMIFGMPLHNHQATAQEQRLSRQLITIWTGFAKTGKLPTVTSEGKETEWPNYSRNHWGNSVVEISASGLRTVRNTHKGHCSKLLPAIGRASQK